MSNIINAVLTELSAQAKGYRAISISIGLMGLEMCTDIPTPTPVGLPSSHDMYKVSPPIFINPFTDHSAVFPLGVPSPTFWLPLTSFIDQSGIMVRVFDAYGIMYPTDCVFINSRPDRSLRIAIGVKGSNTDRSTRAVLNISSQNSLVLPTSKHPHALQIATVTNSATISSFEDPSVGGLLYVTDTLEHDGLFYSHPKLRVVGGSGMIHTVDNNIEYEIRRTVDELKTVSLGGFIDYLVYNHRTDTGRKLLPSNAIDIYYGFFTPNGDSILAQWCRSDLSPITQINPFTVSIGRMQLTERLEKLRKTGEIPSGSVAYVVVKVKKVVNENSILSKDLYDTLGSLSDDLYEDSITGKNNAPAFWHARNSWLSESAKLYGEDVSRVTAPLALAAMGYNGLSTLVGNHVFKNPSIGKSWMIELPLPFANGSTYFTYCSEGYLLGYGALEHANRLICDGEWAYIELLTGVGSDSYSLLTKFGGGFNVPRTSVAYNGTGDSWCLAPQEDSIPSATVVDKSILLPSSEWFLKAYDLVIKEGVLSQPLELMVDGVLSTNYPVHAEIDVWLNGRYMVEGVDYMVSKNVLYVISTMYIDCSPTQRLVVRMRGGSPTRYMKSGYVLGGAMVSSDGYYDTSNLPVTFFVKGALKTTEDMLSIENDAGGLWAMVHNHQSAEFIDCGRISTYVGNAIARIKEVNEFITSVHNYEVRKKNG